MTQIVKTQIVFLFAQRSATHVRMNDTIYVGLLVGSSAARQSAAQLEIVATSCIQHEKNAAQLVKARKSAAQRSAKQRSCNYLQLVESSMGKKRSAAYV